MTPHDPFIHKIVQTLEKQAQQHPETDQVLKHVMHAVQQRPAKRQVWAMSGFALAAAIAGMSLAPNLLSHQSAVQPQTVNTAKLSPQMIEDLEMLSLLGTETKKYGS